MGRRDEAIPIYQGLLRNYERDTGLRRTLANLLYEIDEYEDAARQLEQIVEMEPDGYLAWHALGLVYDRLEDPRALDAWERYIELDADDDPDRNTYAERRIRFHTTPPIEQ